MRTAVATRLVTASRAGSTRTASGAPPKPLFPTAYETTCGCQNWDKVACDGGVKGQTGKCDSLGPQTGATLWYCEDGPGWKPPAELRAREQRERREAADVDQRRRLEGEGAAAELGEPRAPSNLFETLWFAVPLKAGSAKGAVTVDLSGVEAQGYTAGYTVANRGYTVGWLRPH